MEKHSTKRERNCVRIHVCMIFTIFFFLFFFEAPRYLPLDQCLGHLFLKRSIHARVYDLHAGEVERVDWYGNKPVARNFFFFFFFFFLRPCWRWEGGGEHGIGVPRRNVWRNILCVLWDHRVFTRRAARARHSRGKSHGDFRIVAPTVCASICTYLAAVKR